MVDWVKWAPVTFALGLLLGNFTYCSNVADKQTFSLLDPTYPRIIGVH